MKTKMVLHILRNPYGYSDNEVKEARLAACDEIEKLQDSYKNMRDFAESKGLDTTTYGTK